MDAEEARRLAQQLREGWVPLRRETLHDESAAADWPEIRSNTPLPAPGTPGEEDAMGEAARGGNNAERAERGAEGGQGAFAEYAGEGAGWPGSDANSCSTTSQHGSTGERSDGGQGSGTGDGDGDGDGYGCGGGYGDGSDHDPPQQPDAAKNPNAAKCRRYRNKRKREITVVQKRAVELEQERRVLLDKIAGLQNELLVLQGSGGDAQAMLENAALREEIRQHRLIVEGIKRECRFTPEATVAGLREHADNTLEEMVRLGTEMGTGWTQGHPVLLGGRRMPITYQRAMTDRGEVLNLRVLACDVPASAEAFDRAGRTIFVDPEHIQRHLNIFEKVNQDDKLRGRAEEFQLERLMDGLSVSRDTQIADLRLFRIARDSPTPASDDTKRPGSSDGQGAECICVGASRSTEISRDVLEPGSESKPLRLHVSGSGSIRRRELPEPLAKITNFNLPEVTGKVLFGHLVWEAEANPERCNALLVASFPVSDPAFRTLKGLAVPSISHHGKLNPHFETELHTHFIMKIAPILAPE